MSHDDYEMYEEGEAASDGNDDDLHNDLTAALEREGLVEFTDDKPEWVRELEARGDTLIVDDVAVVQGTWDIHVIGEDYADKHHEDGMILAFHGLESGTGNVRTMSIGLPFSGCYVLSQVLIQKLPPEIRAIIMGYMQAQQMLRQAAGAPMRASDDVFAAQLTEIAKLIHQYNQARTEQDKRDRALGDPE